MPTSSETTPEPRRDALVEPASRTASDLVAAAIAVATFATNLIVLTLPFIGKTWLQGDLAYHRGVALSIDFAHPFGEGPIAGVMSYYGGTYHLVLAAISAVLGISFEAAVAVLSVVWALVWPASLIVLGRRLFPADWLPAAVFALVGTLVMPLTTLFVNDLWVESVLPSGMAVWPAYPRDMAVSFGVLAVACFLEGRTAIRVGGSGALLALALTTHPQVAATFVAVVAAWAIYRTVRGDGARALVLGAGAVAVAAILSAWWWLPRIGLFLSGPPLLADAPDRLPFRMDPATFVTAQSWVGLAATVALLVLLVRRRVAGGHPILAVWVLVLVPLLVLDRVGGGSAFAPERRTWLQLSIPFAAIAAFEVVALARRIRRPLGSVVLAAVLVASSLPAAAATVGGLAEVWDDRRISGRDWPPEEWDSTLEALRDRARERPVEILTYDTEAPWVWSLTGARVFSLWLPGPIKLGFDPGRVTGTGYLERVAEASAAFDRGLPGICDLATGHEIGTLLLRSLDGLVGTHDHPFAAPFRTDPALRDATPAERTVEPGVEYVDTGPDWLRVEGGTRLRIPFESAVIRTVVVEVRNIRQELPVRIRLRAGGASMSARTEPRSGVQVLRFDLPPDANPKRLTVASDEPALLLRALGYEPATLGQPTTGAFLVETRAACGD
jgi:hypothetical protein